MKKSVLRKFACLAFAAAMSITTIPARADRVVSVEESDADMVAAISQAQASLGQFLALAKAPPEGTSAYKLKVMVRDGEAVEHFWVTPFHPTKDGFEGTLANDPELVKNVTFGQNLTFGLKDISDWGYEKNGRQVGSYTVCVLFKKMSKEEADYYRENHGFDC